METTNIASDANDKKKLPSVLDYALIIAIAFVISMLLKTFIFECVYVPTSSMEPTVAVGSRHVLSRLSYKNDKPKRGDIVGFIYPDDGKTIYLKRIIGLPGEYVKGVNGIVYINDVPLTDLYPLECEALNEDFGPFLVPENSYFMLGDNRNNSLDSRYWQHPFVSEDKIIGKIVFEFYPKFKIF